MSAIKMIFFMFAGVCTVIAVCLIIKAHKHLRNAEKHIKEAKRILKGIER